MSRTPDSAFPSSEEDELLARILRGERSPWPDLDERVVARLLDLCDTEGLTALVHHRLRVTPEWPAWPEALRQRLAQQSRMAAAVDMLREVELVAVLNVLAAAGVRPLLLKGAALAYTHYAEPSLRSRCDADLLIAAADRPAATAVLEARGYRRPNAVSGTLVSYEDCFSRRIGQLDHVVDLHWQINNAQVFARALTYAEASERAVAVAQLGPSARTLCPPHALLLACMHRAGHLAVDGAEAERRIWLYDIHLLATAMPAEEWREFVELCTAKRMRSIGAEALASAQRAFATAYPPGIVEALRAPGAAELSTAVLDADRRAFLGANLRALPSWKQRAMLIKELLFPPADYMLRKFDTRQRWLLPWLYLRRAVAGVGKFRRR